MQKEKFDCLALRIAFLFLCIVPLTVVAQKSVSIQIDGSKRFQKMDGFGVNINTAWWYNGEYGDAKVVQPAIDMLIDSLGATIFRAVIEEMDWEAVNDDNDPNNFNWTYYNSVFSNAKFQGVWNTLHYLNQKGIINGLIISFMGGPPSPQPLAPKDQQKSWMGGTDYTISPAMEDEFVESIAALLYYARHTAKVQFTLVSPMNETEQASKGESADHPNWYVEGPNMPDAVQFSRVIKKLAQKLDAIGMSDIRFVAPDAAGDQLFASCLEEMVKDSYVMGKLAHWGVHQYGNSAENYRKIVSNPANPNKSYWVTETAGIANLLGQFDDDVNAYIFWDGFDCVYQHGIRNGTGSTPPNDWAFWMVSDEGKPLIEYIPSTKSWTPRKQFYEFAQLFRFVKPGSTMIGSTNNDSSLVVYAFHNPKGQLAIVGHNNGVKPITINGTLANLPGITGLKMTYTNSTGNLLADRDVKITGESFQTEIPSNCIFTISGTANVGQGSIKTNKPEPSDWYSGDIHVHRDCGGSPETVLPESKFVEMMEVNDLAVISVLADMGDGEVKFAPEDLPKVNGKDAPQSVPGRTVHWDAEWHWDPYGATFEHKALGGHIVLLGLTEAHQIWDESTYKILDYGRKQNAVVGFCHTQYLNDQIQNNLNCCIPIEHPVEAALGTVDFFSEDVFSTTLPNNGSYSADATINAYYKLLNCGFRISLAGGTDYPCNSGEPFGSLLTYVKVDGPFTYRKWVDGIKEGRTVVTRNGHKEFLDMKVNGRYIPGDEIKFKDKGSVSVEVKWTANESLSGKLELVYNGKVVASQQASVEPGKPVIFKAGHDFTTSGWICVRRMGEDGHHSHTAPVYLSVNNKPVRASSGDAMFYAKWIDNMIEKTSPGGDWNRYFSKDLDIVQGRYKQARDIYLKIAEEAKKLKN